MDVDLSINKKMLNISKMLDEYSTITIELEKIKEKIFNVRNATKEKLIAAKTNQEKQEIFSQFQKEIKKFKNDTDISLRYKNLKKQKEILRNKIINQFKSNKSDIVSQNSTNINQISTNANQTITNANQTITNVNQNGNANKELSFLINKYLQNNNKDDLTSNISDSVSDNISYDISSISDDISDISEFSSHNLTDISSDIPNTFQNKTATNTVPITDSNKSTKVNIDTEAKNSIVVTDNSNMVTDKDYKKN